MAKRARRKLNRRAKKGRLGAKKVSRRAQKSIKRRKSRRKTPRAVARRAKPSARASAKRSARRPIKKAARKRVARIAAPPRPERLNRERRVLTDEAAVQSPPSSLDMDRHGSAARTGRKGLEANIRRHNAVTPALTGGDVDADWENAYFSGDEAPGGDNLTPDQEDVDDMGKALGVEYQDNEELQGSDKVVKRDEHRWELDPASADDYKDRT